MVCPRVFSEVMYKHVDSADEVTENIEPEEIKVGCGHIGSPLKTKLPVEDTEYRVSVTIEFEEEKTKPLSQDRSVRITKRISTFLQST